MTSLLEAATSLALTGAILSLLSASIVASARVDAAAAGLADRLFQQRQLEHLFDRATTAAGAGPTHPPAVSSVGNEAVVLLSDQDGDGSVNASSSETTTLEVRQIGAEARVRLKLGGQTMTVLAVPRAEATLEARDVAGQAADAASATLVELGVHRDDGEEEDRLQLFSLPGRLWP